MTGSRPLGEGVSFGCRIGGLRLDELADRALGAWLRRLLVEHGLILFEDVEPSDRMQAAIGAVFGPLKEYPVAGPAQAPVRAQVVEIGSSPQSGTLVEIGGRPLLCWMPWHFDQPYQATTNGARILRAGQIAPTGGLTCFLDGIELYRALEADLRCRIETKAILYTMDMSFEQLRFGRPEGFRVLQMAAAMTRSSELARQQPRAIHPAVWVHPTGPKVLHVSPWMAAGIDGDETARGDALLEQLCQAIVSLGHRLAYRHAWRRGDMLVWDNCRMLHAVTGCDPAYPRSMHRSTIEGGYGLGRWEQR